MKSSVGLEALSVYVPRHFLELKTLAQANGVDPAKYLFGLGGRRIAIPTPAEDAVSMAVEAAARLIENYDVQKSNISLVIVGTESGVDAAKPIAAYVHGHLGLSNHCRAFDTTHACYGGTAALRMALAWATANPRLDQKALVICTDIARYDMLSPGEPTQGAGAVAMLIGHEPELFTLDPYPESVYTREVMDFWRPQYRQSALVHGHLSIDCYLSALESTYRAHLAQSGLRWEDFDYLLFHVPFPKMAYKGFCKLYEIEQSQRSPARALPPLESEFQKRTQPALVVHAEVGNSYTGSLYLSLASLMESGDSDVAGLRLGLFSYGSGSCAEYFSGQIGADAAAWRGKIGISRALSERVEIDHPTYRDLRRASEVALRGAPEDVAEHRSTHNLKHIAFYGIRDDQRVYGPVSEAARLTSGERTNEKTSGRA